MSVTRLPGGAWYVRALRVRSDVISFPSFVVGPFGPNGGDGSSARAA